MRVRSEQTGGLRPIWRQWQALRLGCVCRLIEKLYDQLLVADLALACEPSLPDQAGAAFMRPCPVSWTQRGASPHNFLQVSEYRGILGGITILQVRPGNRGPVPVGVVVCPRQ